MAAITVKYIGLYSDLAGTTQETVEIPEEGITTKDLAIQLCEKYGPDFEHVMFEDNRTGWAAALFVDGRAAAMRTMIQDGNVLTITPHGYRDTNCIGICLHFLRTGSYSRPFITKLYQ